MSSETHPVLTIRLRFFFAWEQHRPGGCRCVCRMYHAAPDGGVCMEAADPGLLIQVASDSFKTEGPVPVCRDCYTALAPLAELEA